MTYHVPVLLKECIEGLDIDPKGVYVDVTFGGGGHSREIIKHITTGKLIAFDQDRDAAKNIIDDERFVFVPHNFRFLRNFVKYHGFKKVDGILADLGVSSHHFDTPDRGFSTRFDSPLDMRMNQLAGNTAADVLNMYSEKQLSDLLFVYGEIKSSRKIASKIVSVRGEKPFTTTGDFIDVVKPFGPKNRENKFLAQAFQALRIEVNGEMDVLKEFLEQVPKVLKPDGKLVVITYHSLEDRLVKNFIKTGNFKGEKEVDMYGNIISPLEQVNRKLILPSEEELVINTRSRSAKLRIAKMR